MGSKVVWLTLLLLALAMAAESIPVLEHNFVTDRFGEADVIGESEILMDSEINARLLAQKRYISYGALKANSIPCSRRGNSYYNCQNRQRANPYTRGCSHITRCKRYTG